MLSFFDRLGQSSRREFLSIGSLAGLSLPMLLGAKAHGADVRRQTTTEKAVILLHMHGGPSQIETWDPKMTAPSSIHSATGEVKTTIPGLTFGGTFPKIAAQAHHLAVVRSYHTENGNHDIKPVVSPHTLQANIGSLFSRVVGPLRATGMPTNVCMFPTSVDASLMGPYAQFGNVQQAGQLGAQYGPFVPGAGGPMQRNMSLNVPRDRLDDRRLLLTQLDDLKRRLEGTQDLAGQDRLTQQAFDVILGGIGEAFDLSREDPRVVAKYDTSAYDRASAWAHKNNKTHYSHYSRSLGKLLLLARRLVEHGVGFVTINTAFVWDMHEDVNNLPMVDGMELVGRPFDHAVAAFIEDVENRGLSDRILLVATGEMGRTPTLQRNGGRDHWGRLAPLLMHGGGMTHGQVIGQSARNAGEPASEPLTPRHLVATIMQTLMNPAEVRLVLGLPADVMRIVTDEAAIPGLM